MIAPKLRFSEFKDEWIELSLKEYYSKIRNGFVGVATPFYVENGIKYLQGKNIKDGKIDPKGLIYISEDFHHKKNNSQLKQNDILMVQSGHVGECAVVTQDYENANCHALIILSPDHNEKVNSHFVVYYFYSHYGKKRISEIKTGNTIEHVLASEIKEVTLNFPTPKEQTKIAEFLSTVDNKISQLSRQLELLNQYKKGVMQKIFSQEIRFKNENGEDFGEWEEKTLLEIANFRRGSFPQPYGLPQWLDKDGEPFVQVYDVADNMSLKPTTKIKISKLAQEQSVFAPKGTLIITIQGSIGRIAKMQYDAYVDRTLLIFKDYICEIDVDFFKYSLLLLFNYEKEKADGGVIKTITKESLSKFVIAVPDIEEQAKIAEFLTAIDERIDHTTAQLTQTKQWKKGLLQQMFV